MVYEAVQSDILTVTEYSARMGRALRDVGAAAIEGEVQKVHLTPRGMLYFDLTDGEALLACKVFARDAARLEHTPTTGDLVQIQVDRPDLYPARGSLSLIVSAVSLAGEGELLRRRAALLRRLAAEGLCDPGRRRELPRFPRAVGVIAGQDSDGMSDVVRALTDRWPSVHVVTCASLVQGRAAPGQLIDALARLQDHREIDVIVMARGGGSVQDLVCFDDEGLCRALFACDVPVVCAIGHTDNNPVCNHVAWPAFTPSRSAELVVPSGPELRRVILTAGERLGDVPRKLSRAGERLRSGEISEAMRAGFGARAQHLERARGSLTTVPHRAARELGAERETLAAAATALARAGEHLLTHTRDRGQACLRLMREARAAVERRRAAAGEGIRREAGRLSERAARRLEAGRRDMSHLAQLIAARDFRPRGWLLASAADGTPIRSAAELRAGDHIDLHLHDGSAHAAVDSVNLNPGSRTP